MKIPIGTWHGGGEAAEYEIVLNISRLGKIVSRARKNRKGTATALGGAVRVIRVSIPKPHNQA